MTQEQISLPVTKIRKDFPILSRKVAKDKPLVYLDNAATTQKPRVVIDGISRYYETINANVHRGIHQLSEEATEAYDKAHEVLAGFIGAHSWQEIIFTKNATEALNIVSHSLAQGMKKGDEIILSEMEHHSNLVPWQQLAKKHGFIVKYIPVIEESVLDMEAFKGMLSKKTRVVSVTHMSNVLGTINPIRDISKMAHEVDALCVVDGAQSVPHLAVDVQKLECDFFALSGHKMLGPTGIGALYGKKELLEKMEPFLYGGSMINAVSFEESSWNELPWKFEAGTPVIAQGVGLAEAVKYLTALGMDNVLKHEQELVKHAFDVLGEIPGLKIYGLGPDGKRGGVVSFWLEPVHPHDLASVLNHEGIAIRAGHHCAMPLVLKLGVPALARASFYIYNTTEEIDALAAGVKKALEIFR